MIKPRPINAAGFPISRGSGSGLYYCGRTLGTAAIPGSDGTCGPSDGPQCADCAAVPPPMGEPGSPPFRARGPPLRAAGPSGWCIIVVFLNLISAGLIAALASGSLKQQSMFIAAGVGYLVYIIVSLCSPSGKALRNCMSQAEFDAYVSRIRRTSPKVTASITCYHYETRHHRESYTDKDGERHHRHYTTEERVVTHSAKESWAYAWCRDVSGPPVYQPHLRAVRVRVAAVQDFTSRESRAVYDAWKANFFSRNISDARQDKECKMTVPGLLENVMLKRGGEGGILSAEAHTFAVLLLCGGLYEACVLADVPSVRWGLVKQLHANF